MTCFIQWCNDNSGFLSALLSIIGLIMSMIAIIVSIKTARLPYKKKLLLNSTLSVGASIRPGLSAETSIIGITAAAINVGNRSISLTYLGYAVKKDGKFNKLYPFSRDFDCTASLSPSEMKEVLFYTDELLKCFSREKPEMRLYVYAKDTEET